jgi:hypothetical protein
MFQSKVHKSEDLARRWLVLKRRPISARKLGSAA